MLLSCIIYWIGDLCVILSCIILCYSLFLPMRTSIARFQFQINAMPWLLLLFCRINPIASFLKETERKIVGTFSTGKHLDHNLRVRRHELAKFRTCWPAEESIFRIFFIQEFQ